MANSDYVVSKDRSEVMHLPTGLIWLFKRTPDGYWNSVVMNMNNRPKWPADRLARLSRQAGKALQKEWEI